MDLDRKCRCERLCSSTRTELACEMRKTYLKAVAILRQLPKRDRVYGAPAARFPNTGILTLYKPSEYLQPKSNWRTVKVLKENSE